jgi:hypothetical protein
MRGPTQPGSTQVESSVAPIGDVSAQVEVIAADALLGTEGVRANKVERRSEDGTGGDVSAPRSLRGLHWGLAMSNPGLCSPRGTTSR